MRLLRAGRALLLRDAAMGTHLWFVLTDPDPLVLVLLVSVKPHTDRTLQLDVGDHDFIQHPSAVAFGTARYAPADKLEAALSSGRATLHCRAKFPP